MTDPLVAAIIAVGLLVAALATVAAVRDRPPGRWQYGGLALLTLLLVGQAVVAVGRMVGGDRPGSLLVFLSYLVAVVFIPPAAAATARLEPTRWGSAIVAGASALSAVLVVRLTQVWDD